MIFVLSFEPPSEIINSLIKLFPIPSKRDPSVSFSSHSELRVGIMMEKGAGIIKNLLTFDNYKSSFRRN